MAQSVLSRHHYKLTPLAIELDSRRCGGQSHELEPSEVRIIKVQPPLSAYKDAPAGARRNVNSFRIAVNHELCGVLAILI